MALAFFDLDRTLLSFNSGRSWVDFERREGRVSGWTALKAAFWIGGYHLGFSKMEPLLLEAIAALKDEEETAIRERTRRFFATEVQGRWRPGALSALKKHQEQGDTVALLTTSSLYLSEAVAEVVGIPHICCTRFEVLEGRFTGKPLGDLCFGAGKIGHARQLGERLGISLQDAIFYTDSASDLPAMESMGKAVAVNPDPTLKRAAQKRGWAVVDWGS